MKRYNVLSVLVLSFVLVSIKPLVFANKDAEAKIKFRQSGMMLMRLNMGVIKKNVIKKPQSYNKQAVIKAANVLHAATHSNLFSLFTLETEKGIGWKPTRVKTTFFQYPERVEKYVENVRMQSTSLIKSAQEGEVSEIKTSFKNLLKACQACHKDFRGD